MAQSRVSAPGDQGIGTRAADLGVVGQAAARLARLRDGGGRTGRTLELGPHEYNSKKAQGVAVVLPDKPVQTVLPTPVEGSSSGGAARVTATPPRCRVPTSPYRPAGATLKMQLHYNIEEDYDYAYVEVESGRHRQLGPAPHDGRRPRRRRRCGRDRDRRGQRRLGAGDLRPTPYAGQTIGLRARYITDGGVMGQNPGLGWSGVFIDDIQVTAGATTVFADGAENPPNGWTLDGFAVGRAPASPRSTTSSTWPATGPTCRYDKYLKTGPYNFGWPDRPDFVEHFPYQDGLLVNYWDTSYTDNNTSRTRVAARSCRSTRTRVPTTTWRAPPGVVGSRTTTRRSGCRRPTRSRST